LTIEYGIAMELTYMVRGGDGKEYGPATLEQLSGWVREGRLPAGQEVKRSDMQYWAPAAQFSELQPVFASMPNAPAVTTAPAASPAAATQKGPATVAQMKAGASWFYWVAGLSLVNSIAAFSGSTWRFILGLGITQVFDALAVGIGSGGKAVVLALDLLAAGVFVFFGVFAHKAQTWAFIVGMVLFGLDGLIFLMAQDWLGVSFHVFVLYCLFRGLSACRELNKGG
jgi:hypothetical protein